MTPSMSLLLIFFYFELFNAFNLDTKYPIVYSDPYKDYQDYKNIPMDKSSYFGYSLILYTAGNISWIRIGAPRGNTPYLNYSNPGVVFECPVLGRCNLIHLDIGPESTSRTEKYYYRNKLDNAFIGGTMDLNLKFNKFVTCGSRWTSDKREIFSNKIVAFYMIGACFWSNLNTIETHRITPLLPELRFLRPLSKNTAIYDYGVGQGGFSAHLPLDKLELLLGAPGVYNWHGTSIICQELEENSDPVSSKLRSGRNSESIRPFGNINVANAENTIQSVPHDLLGYAVTSGYFFRRDRILYVTSAPKGAKLYGKVLIHDFSNVNDRALHVEDLKQGTQLGEYFGGSLTAGDINDDKYDDLIVGAPYHTSEKYNEGRIYVFLGNPLGRFRAPEHSETIDGKYVNGQFGTAIQYLGDLDLDGYGDIAVAAPYEEDTGGVVYIFKGTSQGLNAIASQRIVGKDISNDILGFGMSISRSADIDGNLYPDVAIGAYKSGHAVVLRAKPIVTISHKILSSVLKLKEGANEYFQVTVCFYAEFNQKDHVIKILRIITVDTQVGTPRAILSSPNLEETTLDLKTNSSVCDNVTIKVTKFEHYEEPIMVSLSHRLITIDTTPVEPIYIRDNKTEVNDLFCAQCPIDDKYRSSNKTHLAIPIVRNCGSDDVCHTNLILTARFLNLKENNTFVLKSSSSVTLEINIENSDERAYLTRVLIVLPEGIHIAQAPRICGHGNTSAILCEVGNPIEPNTTKNISLELDMNNLNRGRSEDSVDIFIKISTTSRNTNSMNFTVLTMKLRREADITISGKSDQEFYYFGNTSNEILIFSQTFQVRKTGVSPIDQVLIEILIPYAIELFPGSEAVTFLQLYTPKGVLSGQEILFDSNTSYIINQQRSGVSEDLSITNDVVENDRDVKHLRRSLRQISNESKLNQTTSTQMPDYTKHRTYYINCSTPQIRYTKVSGTAGPFESEKNIAFLEIAMIFNITQLKDVLTTNKKDRISFATHAYVVIKQPANFTQHGDEPDEVDVITDFVGERLKSKIEIWIIIVAVIAGILLLLLLIFGLLKVGFFKRSKKHELYLLKEELAHQQDVDEVSQDTLDNEEDFLHEEQK